MKIFKFLPIASFLWLLPSLQAWDDFGHMSVASVAYRQLDAAAQKRVMDLLKLNPYFDSKWPAKIPSGATAAERDEYIVMLAATWPDSIKSDSQYHDDGAENGNRPTGPEASRNTGYDDFNRHKYWHFVDTPFTQDGSPLPAVPMPDAKTQIDAFRAVLRSTQPDPLKSYDLVWLLHLVGDIHQPLHSATRVSKKDPDGDAGGNNVTFCTATASKCTSELHAFWDDILGTSKLVKSARTFALGLTPPAVSAADLADTQKWIDRNFELAKTKVYISPVKQGDGPYRATATYTTKAKNLAKQQVALAGARMAAIIKADLQ